ncbi:hypothetical protein KF728_21580 [Candidatus Obscuribacterales bacterium]|nr:hypothetical protein [Candidatus Obscuribacterales bacterium]
MRSTFCSPARSACRGCRERLGGAHLGGGLVLVLDGVQGLLGFAEFLGHVIDGGHAVGDVGALGGEERLELLVAVLVALDGGGAGGDGLAALDAEQLAEGVPLPDEDDETDEGGDGDDGTGGHVDFSSQIGHIGPVRQSGMLVPGKTSTDESMPGSDCGKRRLCRGKLSPREA